MLGTNGTPTLTIPGLAYARTLLSERRPVRDDHRNRTVGRERELHVRGTRPGAHAGGARRARSVVGGAGRAEHDRGRRVRAGRAPAGHESIADAAQLTKRSN